MRGEKEKMLAGEWFDPHDAELTADRDRATRLMHRLNVECCGHGDDYRTTLGELCPNVRGFIREPFHCDYGYNIHVDRIAVSTEQSGVSDVEIADNALVTVYNLSGARVAERMQRSDVSTLTPGCYIVRSATATEKVIVR